MGKIILPEPRYHFMKQESRSLDLEVDKLTRDFYSDEELREVLAEQYYWENVPGNWREAGSPAVIARIVRGMLDYIDVVRNEIAHYTLPTIVIPNEAQEYQKRLLMQEEWEDDLVLQGQVSEFEKALEESYFEFCKQAMAHLLANIAGEPLVEYRSPRYQALHRQMEPFKPEIFSDCDNAYYNAAKAKFHATGPKAEVLQKHQIGKLFVMEQKDVKGLLGGG